MTLDIDTVFRDNKIKGDPHSGEHWPIKAEIRALLKEIAETAQSTGLAFPSVAALNAALNYPANTRAEVAGDGVNDGIYSKVGAPGTGSWEFLGQSILTKLQAAVEPDFLTFNNTPIYDATGVYGAAERFYLPRNRWVVRNGQSEQGTLTATPSRISGYREIANPGAAGRAWAVYYDLDGGDDPYKAVAFPAALPIGRAERIVLIAILWGTNVVWSGFDILRAEELNFEHLYFRRPIIVTSDKVLVPRFYYRSRIQTWQEINPADGSDYWELPFQTGANNGERIFFDKVAFDAGDTSPVKRVNGSTAPLAPDHRAPLILRAMNGQVESPYPIARMVRNQYQFGKEGFDLAPTRYTNTTFADVSNSDLLALGFKRGAVNSDSGRPYVGGVITDPTPGAQSVFARVFVQTDTPNNFGNLGRLYLFRPGTSAVLTSVLTLEKKISSTAAIFSATIVSPEVHTINRWWAGMEGAGVGLLITGVQFAMSPDRHIAVDREDFPAPAIGPEILYPDAMYLIDERPLPFYPQQVSQARRDVPGYQLSLGSVGPSSRPYTIQAHDRVEIDSRRLGSTIEITGRVGSSDMRVSRSVAVRRAANRFTGAKNILMIGDSLTNFAMPGILKQVLEACGMTPTFIGKYNSALQGSSATSTDGPLAEGQPGWEFGDWTYAKTDRIGPLEPGDEAAYEAMTKAQKFDVNAWLRPEVGTEASARNGYVFDPEFWRTRWSVNLAIPDVVLLNLGTNDARDNAPPATFDAVRDGLEIMVPALRAAWPSAEIGLYFPAVPMTLEGANRWTHEHAEIARIYLEYVRDLGDAKVNFIAGYAHMSQDVGWELTTESTTPAGTAQALVSDSIHFNEIPRRELAEPLAAFVGYEVGTQVSTTGMLELGLGVTKTISSGVITVDTGSHIIVDTEGGASTDDLVTINGGRTGTVILLHTAASARDVTVKHGTGNIYLDGQADFTLTSSSDALLLYRNNAGNWNQIGGGNNA